MEKYEKIFNIKDSSHEFAIFWPHTSSFSHQKKQIIRVTDRVFIHRVKNILRLKADETLIIFDEKFHRTAKITDFSSNNSLIFEISPCIKNIIHKPFITIFIPLLKKEALAHAVYNAVELGTNKIQLIITQKSSRIWQGKKSFERLQSIMYAAAEQSKNFSIPTLHEPIFLNQAIKNPHILSHTKNFFLDPQGEKFCKIIKKNNINLSDEIIILVGPEGDLSKEEKNQILHTFKFCALTNTVLRAHQAITIALGILRSC